MPRSCRSAIAQLGQGGSPEAPGHYPKWQHEKRPARTSTSRLRHSERRACMLTHTLPKLLTECTARSCHIVRTLPLCDRPRSDFLTIGRAG